MRIPRIVIAGTNSGCGKTTISMGIMAALAKRGYNIQPFKVGPDYIDPMFHTFITGNSSRNLDSWMLGRDTAKGLFCKNASGADMAVIEGVMGIYDGYGGYSLEGSTAEVAKITGSPVILVVNGEGLSLSIAALIRGYRDFDGSVEFKGVIINNIKSSQHYELLKEIVHENTGLEVLGYLPKMNGYGLESRHLGLVPSEEVQGLKEKVEALAGQIEKTIDLELLVKISREASEIAAAELASFTGGNTAFAGSKVRIAVARDRAYNFYYRDNLDLLEELGAEIIDFSPIEDKQLPADIQGLYIGGGYPEVWAAELQENRQLRQEVYRRIAQGLPTYAECGGLMYLSESIRNREGECFSMVGIIPGQSEMTASLKRFGYVEVEAVNDSSVAEQGEKIRAHEFHYSQTSVSPAVETAFRVVKRRRNSEPKEWMCGFKRYNLVAGYPHLHFWANPRFAECFIAGCRKFEKINCEAGK